MSVCFVFGGFNLEIKYFFNTSFVECFANNNWSCLPNNFSLFVIIQQIIAAAGADADAAIALCGDTRRTTFLRATIFFF